MVAPSLQALAKKLLVVGGTGGVGFQVCKVAVARGWDVTSLSRRGKPTLTEANQKDFVAPQGWTHKVNWAQGDSLDPSSYKEAIAGTDSVVHTVGLLLEDNYKEILHSQNFDELSKSVQTAIRGQNPLDTRKTPKTGLTYERVNRDTAITVANEAAKEGIESFAYISAAFAPPMVPNRYITTKREAETALLTHPAGFRSIIFRPGFLSTPDRPVTLPLAGLLKVSSAILGDSVRGTIPFAQALSTPPLEMETLARAIVNSLENPEVRGIVDVEGIAELANNPHTHNVGASKKAVEEEKKEPKDSKLE
ncbi:NAD(P)-binding protein [Linnemannia elongata AG-77]|uniref:NAD(P)-binding protein n=1 Tax=Linnemannia elongata AG-77 TaxID=1314771 RepID=A0A197JQB4_9FUNG|nr:NAD(P)-binding protein [Linnemannia elongata AG-77]